MGHHSFIHFLNTIWTTDHRLLNRKEIKFHYRKRVSCQSMPKLGRVCKYILLDSIPPINDGLKRWRKWDDQIYHVTKHLKIHKTLRRKLFCGWFMLYKEQRKNWFVFFIEKKKWLLKERFFSGLSIYEMFKNSHSHRTIYNSTIFIDDTASSFYTILSLGNRFGGANLCQILHQTQIEFFIFNQIRTNFNN